MSIKNMKHLVSFGMLCVSGMLFADAGQSAANGADKADADYVEFIVNGKTIRHSEVGNVFNSVFPSQNVDKMSNDQIATYKKSVENMLIANILLREQAEKTHVERDKDFRAALQKYKESLMTNFYIQKFIAERIKQASIANKIVQLEKEFKNKKEKKVCFIVTSNEENAKKAIADLTEGKDFVETAKKYCVLPNDAAKEQAAQGTYMPVMEKIPMLPEEISVAINSLENGKFTTEPVKAGTEYYVIKITDERQLQISKEHLAKIAYAQLRAEELKKLVSNLIAAANIKRMNEKGEEVKFDKAPINSEDIITPDN